MDLFGNKKHEMNDDGISKLKSFLLLLIDEFTSKHPSELDNKPTEIIYDEEHERIY